MFCFIDDSSRANNFLVVFNQKHSLYYSIFYLDGVYESTENNFPFE